jgi:hypothetical protein
MAQKELQTKAEGQDPKMAIALRPSTARQRLPALRCFLDVAWQLKMKRWP